MPRRERYGARDIRNYHIRLPAPLADQMELVIAMGDGRHGRFQRWIEQAIRERVEKQMQTLPGVHLWLRPHGKILKMDQRGVYQMIAQGAGGERVWLLGTVNDLPDAVQPGGYGFRCDITSDAAVGGGFDGRDVVVPADDVQGVAPR